ncbi:hypothetical protein AAHA92_25865 [Salvia divinorum]|uniref:Uncharacterized protein n=1 Tax=Salvia divinorum TaxID=28513 RepID=A0ABD1GF60_SALDI
MKALLENSRVDFHLFLWTHVNIFKSVQVGAAVVMAEPESRRRRRRSGGGRGSGCCYCSCCLAFAVAVLSLLLNYYLCYSGFFGDCGKGKFGFINYFLKENRLNFLAAPALRRL